MKKALERYPFFLLLLPAFVVVHFEKEFGATAQYEFIYDRIIILFALPVLLAGFWYVVFRSWKKSSLMTFCCLVVFYYTGELKNWLSDKFYGAFFTHYIFLIPFLGTLLLIAFLLLKKHISFFYRTSFVLNILLLLFIAADIVQILFLPGKQRYGIVPEMEIKDSNCSNCVQPDIYYIIFDAYTSPAQLAKDYNYYNPSITDYLKENGFVIPEASKSNYNYTALSIASVFNMSYLTNIDTSGKLTDREYHHILKYVYKNKLFPFLLRRNYKIYNHSIFNTETHPAAVKNMDIWNIRNLIDQQNLLFKLSRDIGYHFPGKIISFFQNDKYNINTPANRSRVTSVILNNTIQSIEEQSAYPKFVYAHFLTTHPPFYSDSTGKVFSGGPPSDREAYIHQVAYSNNIIKQIAARILDKKQRPVVIIFQSDHGISFDEPVNPQKFFPNFNALYFSNKDYRLINDSLHNVNTFRIVLNTYFNQQAELLPYQSYFTKWFHPDTRLNSE